MSNKQATTSHTTTNSAGEAAITYYIVFFNPYICLHMFGLGIVPVLFTSCLSLSFFIPSLSFCLLTSLVVLVNSNGDSVLSKAACQLLVACRLDILLRIILIPLLLEIVIHSFVYSTALRRVNLRRAGQRWALAVRTHIILEIA